MFEDLLKDLGECVGIPGLEFNQDGALTLSFEGQKMYLQRLEEHETLFFVFPLGALSTDRDARLHELEVIARANCFGRDLAGGYLGADDNLIAYSIELKAGALAYDSLKECLHSMLEVCKRLKLSLEAAGVQHSDAQETTIEQFQNWIGA